jgi:hypothetical protein
MSPRLSDVMYLTLVSLCISKIILIHPTSDTRLIRAYEPRSLSTFVLSCPLFHFNPEAPSTLWFTPPASSETAAASHETSLKWWEVGGPAIYDGIQDHQSDYM